MRIIADKSRCIAAGQCVLKSPTLFDQQEEDGMVIVLNDNPSSEMRDAARLAARVCPSGAILIEED